MSKDEANKQTKISSKVIGSRKHQNRQQVSED